MRNRLMLGIVLATLLARFAYTQPITFQGFLWENGIPANGTYDILFQLTDTPSQFIRGVNVQNGLFTVTLNFSGAAWNGNERSMSIAVFHPEMSFVILQPRVKINPVPYAAYALRPWQTGGNGIFYTDGSVGIGTNNPFARLSLGGGEANTKLALWQGSNPEELMGFGIGPNQFRIHLSDASNRFSFLNTPNGDEIFTISGNGNVGINTANPAQRLHVIGDSMLNGNVGIGTLSPSQRLHVEGSGYFSGKVGIGTSTPFAALSLGSDNANTKLALWQGANPGELLGFGVAPNQFRIHLHDSDDRFLFLDNENGNTLATISGNGEVGFLTESGYGFRLRVSGKSFFSGGLYVGGNRADIGGNSNGWRVSARADEQEPGQWVGVIETLGAFRSPLVLVSSHISSTNHGGVVVFDQYGSQQAGLYVDSRGRGVLFADLKPFRVPDPEDPTRDIWYATIEGPEVAMYVRGTARLVNGRAWIDLPDHFRKLADEQGMTVQLTPLSSETLGLCVVRKSLEGIEVAELLGGRGNYEFDWRVEAIRKEHRDFQVYRPWNETLLGGVDPAQAWEARLKSIQASREHQTRSQAHRSASKP